jgi:beta-glucanase (GH16 family)
MRINNKLKTLGCSSLLALFLLMTGETQAQNWQLVWSDEFNGSIGPDWSFETGNGANGWGNLEKEYYQQQNASIINYAGGNGVLAITAKNQSVGGFNYTSARMKTQGHRSWKYGKIVASISLPAFQGSWPAFWMLGDNIGSVGWPQCGELDIMEQIDTANTVYGSTHWWVGSQADFSGNTGVSVTNWHEYSITWDSQYIKWFVDGNQYNQFYIGNNNGGTNAFNNNTFFIILNMAVGGNWPGFSIDNSRLPASMLVDWVHVYQNNPGLAQGTYAIGSYGDLGTSLQATSDTYWSSYSNSYDNGVYEVAATPYTNGWSYQQWAVTPIGNGQYHIINKAENLSLQATGDPYNNGHGIVGGCDKIALTPNYWNISQQVWQINPSSQGYVLASPANSQNLQASQDSYRGSSSNYQVLGSPYSWGVGSNQQWNMVWVSN